jgi:hypothetical protein
MSAFAKLATTAVTVAIIGIVGIIVLPQAGSLDRPGGAPSPSPTPSALPYTWPGSLGAGTYATDFAFDLPVSVTFTVPDGWQSRDIEVRKGERVAVSVLIVDNLFADPCTGQLQEPPMGPTPDDLAEALTAMPGLISTAPSPTTMGGLGGTYLEWQLSPDAGCPPLASSLFRLAPFVCDAGCGGLGSQDLGVVFPVHGVLNRAWLLEAGGGLRLVIQAVSSPDATVEDLAELQGVVDSIGIVPKGPAGASPSPEPS